LQVSLNPATAPDAPIFRTSLQHQRQLQTQPAHISRIQYRRVGVRLTSADDYSGRLHCRAGDLKKHSDFGVLYNSRGRFLPTFINKNIAPATATQTLTVTSGEFAGQSFTVRFTQRVLIRTSSISLKFVAPSTRHIMGWYCKPIVG